ncbi:MAG: Major Facilitator Superfamily transporter [Anaerocolumna sp.]|nr:Major Facilitator Superfamily transporter [Anaerocolumna sp.]
MNKYYFKPTFPSKVRSRYEALLSPLNRPLLIFSIEGIFFAIISNMINNNNNLFALRLGASDLQVSLVSSIPQFVGVLVLIPVGILTDRMRNKQRMVTLSLFLLAFFYVMIGFVPILGEYKLLAFLVLLSLSIGPLTSYNASWQAYFSDVVPFEGRNRVLTMRTGSMFLINIGTPLVTGALLASVLGNSEKIRFHQIFYFTAAVILIIQIFTLKKIKEGEAVERNFIKLSELKITLSDLVHHKPFMKFLGTALFFYLTWHADWTLYFLGQVNYLKMNEAWLSYVSIGAAAAQFLTIGLWSRINERIGPRFGIIFGNLGLALCPICMIVGTSLPISYAPVVFLIMNTFANFALANVSLSLPQYLLISIPEHNKTLSIAIYTVFITLSNAIMPMAGVKIYTLLGANLNALQMVFWGLFVLRIMSSGLWCLNWRKTRNI